MAEVHHPPRRGGKALLRLLWHRTPTKTDPGAEFGGAIAFPQAHTKAPLRQVLRRLVLAQLVFVVTTMLVYLDRDGYNDNSDGQVDFLDAAYYTTVSLSTTGYGDITPVNDLARITNIFVITPLRILFPIILVGTTLEVLTDKTRQLVRTHRLRSRMRDHTVVVGYGTKGRHTIKTLIVQGTPKETPEEAGHSPRVCEDLVLAVVRNGQILHFTEPAAETLEAGDHVVTVRQAEPIASLPIRRKSLVWGL